MAETTAAVLLGGRQGSWLGPCGGDLALDRIPPQRVPSVGAERAIGGKAGGGHQGIQKLRLRAGRERGFWGEGTHWEGETRSAEN